MVWLQIGYSLVVFMAGLARVDPSLYEAAELDGAGAAQRFWYITLPMLQPEIFVVGLTTTIAALKVFAPVYRHDQWRTGQRHARALVLLLLPLLLDRPGRLRRRHRHGADGDHHRAGARSSCGCRRAVPRSRAMTEDALSLGGPARPPARANLPRSRRGALRWWVLALLVAFLVFMLAPIFLALNNAIKTSADYATHGPLALPQSFTIEGLLGFWAYVDFTKKLWNSLLLSGAAAVFGVVLSLLNAYAIGIGRVKGGRVMLVILLLGIMIPQESLVYPLYYLSKAVGLYDSLWSPIIIFTVLQSIFGTYLLAAVMTTFPREILEAARVDGANRLQILWYVVTPILRPTLAVLATFFFIWTWNEFLIPLVLLVSNTNQTVSVAMGALSGQYVSQPTITAAAALLGITPTIIFFLIFQRTLTKGVVVGAVK